MPTNFLDALLGKDQDDRNRGGLPPIGPTPFVGTPRIPPPPGLKEPTLSSGAGLKPPLNPGPGLADIVRRSLTEFAGPSLVDLAKFMATPSQTNQGFYQRLFDDQLTPEDQAAATEALGAPITPPIRQDIIGQLTRSVAEGLAKTGRFVFPGVAAAMDVRAGREPDVSMLPPPNLPRFGGPGAPFGGPGPTGPTPNAPTGSVADEPIGPQLPPGGYPSPAAAGSPQPVGAPGSGFTVSGGRTGLGGALLRAPDGRVLGRSVPGQYGGDSWEFTADPTDENIDLALQSGMFPAGDLMKLRSSLQGMFKTGRDIAWGEINNQAKMDLDALTLKLKANEIELGAAKLAVDKILAEANKAKVEADIAMTMAQLRLQPLVEQQTRQQIAELAMKMDQSEQRFPYELQLMEEQIAESQSRRSERERAVQRQQAGDAFMGQMMPGLLAAMGGKGSAAFAGAQLGQPETGAPPAAPTQPSNAGPGPVYAALAQNAGVAPNDPAAQMAWAVLSEMFNRQGSSESTPLA